MNTPLNLKDAILNLQRYLRAISFADSRITRVPIDGIYGSDTQKAVAEYQRTRGLPETGIVDKSTWDSIYDEYRILTRSADRAPSVNFFPTVPDDYEAARGERSTFITAIQLLLRELSVIYDDFPTIEISGVFDAPTEEAVKIFQLASGLPPTGRVDLVTWNRMGRDFENYRENQ